MTPKVSAIANFVGVDNAAPLGRETGYILAVGRIKPGRLEVAEDTSGEPVADQHLLIATEAQEPVSNKIGQLIQLMSSRLETGLKQVSLAAWRDTSLEPMTEGFRHVVASEGIERIIDELRRAPALAALEGGMIAIEVDPTANPAGTYIHWQDRMPAEFEARMRSASAQDPTRPFQSRLPVGLAFDLRDIADKALLSSSAVYTSIYDTLDDSWVSVVLERTITATWLLTCWHRITKESDRVHARTALQRLAGPLRVAFHRIGLFGEPPPAMKADGSLRAKRSRFVRGIRGPLGDGRKTDFGIGREYGNITVVSNINPLAEAGPHSLSDWSDAALEAQAEVLRSRIEREREALRRIDEERKERLGFAGAVSISDFKARAVHLIEAFDSDPRPLVIVVSGTDRTCILKPVDPNDLPTTVVPVSRMGPQGSSLVEGAAGEGARGGARIGIRRGGVRTGNVVAELCAPNADSQLYISVLRSLGQFG